MIGHLFGEMFGWPQGIVVGNLIASAIVGLLGFTHQHLQAERRHREQMAQRQRQHRQLMAALGRPLQPKLTRPDGTGTGIW